LGRGRQGYGEALVSHLKLEVQSREENGRRLARSTYLPFVMAAI